MAQSAVADDPSSYDPHWPALLDLYENDLYASDIKDQDNDGM